jgi:hypothetical protein
MVPSLDIFRIESGGVLWCESAATIETAKARIQKLGLSSPGSYLILTALLQALYSAHKLVPFPADLLQC